MLSPIKTELLNSFIEGPLSDIDIRLMGIKNVTATISELRRDGWPIIASNGRGMLDGKELAVTCYYFPRCLRWDGWLYHRNYFCTVSKITDQGEIEVITQDGCGKLHLKSPLHTEYWLYPDNDLHGCCRWYGYTFNGEIELINGCVYAYFVGRYSETPVMVPLDSIVKEGRQEFIHYEENTLSRVQEAG